MVYSSRLQPQWPISRLGGNDTTIRIYDVKDMKEIKMIGGASRSQES
jgi:hypothetical protein